MFNSFEILRRSSYDTYVTYLRKLYNFRIRNDYYDFTHLTVCKTGQRLPDQLVIIMP